MIKQANIYFNCHVQANRTHFKGHKIREVSISFGASRTTFLSFLSETRAERSSREASGEPTALLFQTPHSPAHVRMWEGVEIIQMEEARGNYSPAVFRLPFPTWLCYVVLVKMSGFTLQREVLSAH